MGHGWKLTNYRTRIDIASLYQIEQFTNLTGGVQAAVDRIRELELCLAQQSQSIEDSGTNILSAITNSALSSGEDHERTRNTVVETASTLQETSAVNYQETLRQATSLGYRSPHEITMTEIELIRAATEQQVKELREEIRQLKLEIERSVQQIVASVGKVSASEQQRLKETSNAKFNVWVAKEIVLKNLLEILRIFKSQIGDGVAAFESATWKMQPYPTIKPFRSTTETQPCPDIEPETKMRSPDIVGPLSEDPDRGSNIAYAEALQIIRRNSCVFDLYKFNLESDRFFDNVFRCCSPGFRYQCAQILLKAGAKPTYKSLIEALQCREGDAVSLLGDWTTTENLTRNSHHLAGGRKSQSDSERFSQLLRCCDSHELSELVYLLNKCPELINEQIEGALSLTVAAQSANADVVAILSLYGSPLVCTEDIHKSPLLVAIDRLNLEMACTMIDYHSSPLEPGWEWPALTSLADKNFKAPAQSIDYIIEQIGILHGLRLAIEHRHERLIRFMLWRFKLKSPDTGSAEVLEMAVQSGICREYAEHVKGYVEENTGLVEVADSPVPVFRTCSRRRSDGQIGMRVLNLARR
ncbi:hypothetical protein QBC37DRAFT_450955 [Rhypophila decipiens]|uniref:Ankyrin repeat protein n=1 Tax=Rhypophila decipiens TaxID=261697 RepID=A0AAN6YGE7_9PEZI|nr:hypothetical protein QBC37DRAFT_450955 [Rhypophila decipiens]